MVPSRSLSSSRSSARSSSRERLPLSEPWSGRFFSLLRPPSAFLFLLFFSVPSAKAAALRAASELNPAVESSATLLRNAFLSTSDSSGSTQPGWTATLASIGADAEGSRTCEAGGPGCDRSVPRRPQGAEGLEVEAWCATTGPVFAAGAACVASPAPVPQCFQRSFSRSMRSASLCTRHAGSAVEPTRRGYRRRNESQLRMTNLVDPSGSSPVARSRWSLAPTST